MSVVHIGLDFTLQQRNNIYSIFSDPREFQTPMIVKIL